MATPDQFRPPDNGEIRLDCTAPPPPGGAGKSVLSFAAVTKANLNRRFPLIRLAARQYGHKEGKPSISFTHTELQAGVDNLKHSLVAKFSGGRPHIEEVRKAFMATWGLSGQCSIGAWDARHILIVLDSEIDARKVLAHPWRKLGHAFFRVFRWTKDFSTRREPTTTSTWVRLGNLPPEMYNQGYIEPIISSFGRFLAVDSKTTTFTNPSYARVCVEVDPTKELPDKVWIATGVDVGFWQNVTYESRLPYCSKCRLHGHGLVNCRKAKLRREEEQRTWEARDDFGLPLTSMQDAAPKLPAEEIRSLSLTKKMQTSKPSDDDNDNSGWIVVQKRKEKKKAFNNETKLHAGCPDKGTNAPPNTEEILAGNCPKNLDYSPIHFSSDLQNGIQSIIGPNETPEVEQPLLINALSDSQAQQAFAKHQGIHDIHSPQPGVDMDPKRLEAGLKDTTNSIDLEATCLPIQTSSFLVEDLSGSDQLR